MNEYDDPRDEELAQRLRALPSERVPPAVVWQRIAAQLAQEPAPRAVAPVAALERAPRQSPRRHWRRLAAVAAAVLVLVGGASLLLPRQVPAPAQPMAANTSPLQQQANLLTHEYRQAIAIIPAGSVPAELRPAIDELDASAANIRTAIAQSPQAGFLLGQLQRTYALRLELTRQGLGGAGSII